MSCDSYELTFGTEAVRHKNIVIIVFLSKFSFLVLCQVYVSRKSRFTQWSFNIYPRGGKYTREEVLELSHPKELKKLKLMHS